MDISIIGAWGAIGRQTAISLVQNRILDPTSRLQLVGRRGGESEHALVGFASDLKDAYAETIPEIDVALDPEDVLGDIIIVAGGATLAPGSPMDRRALALRNLPLFEQYADVIQRSGHGQELILVVTNPVELGVAVFARGHPRRRVIGMGGYLDTLRFRREIAAELGIRRQNVQGMVLGEHGTHMVPCWSTVSAFGFDSPEGRARIRALHRSLSQAERQSALSEIQHLTRERGPTAAFTRLEQHSADLRMFLKPLVAQMCGAKTTLGTAEMIVRLVETISSGKQMLAAAQIQVEGEFLGIHGITGVPVMLSSTGVLSVEPLQLVHEEAIAVIEAAEESSALIRELVP